MNSFYRILYKLYNIDNIDLPLNTSFNNPILLQIISTDVLLYSYLTIMSKKYRESDDSNERIIEKYIQFDIQLKNNFLTSMHDVFIKRFGKAQRCYFTLSRLARLWKVKRSPVRICTDLCGNNLDPNATNCMVIYQNDSLYYFSVSDLINICKNALMQASYLFVISPICPKNSYTNVAFSKPILYAIYWKIRRSDYKMPILLQLYYDTFFDETIFLYKHEPIIRDLYMKDILKMSDETVLEPFVKKMLREFELFTPFNIDPSFHLKNCLKSCLLIYDCILYTDIPFYVVMKNIRHILLSNINSKII